jgi:glycosyltransferase involved in cell wall biosynthesis
LISICIPTYNYAQFLPQALESVLDQTVRDFEVIVIDDASSDGTGAVMSQYASRDGRVRCITNPANTGMVDNWNRCLSQARGEFIKFVFADDFLLMPKALELLLGLFNSHPSLSLACSSREAVDYEGRRIQTLSPFKQDVVMAGTAMINLCLSEQKNLVGEPTAVMFRRKQAMRGFEAGYRQIVDQEMWFHLLEQGDFGFLREPLCAFRRHRSQQTIVNRSQPVPVLNDVFALQEAYLRKEYITIGWRTRCFIRYDAMYRIWKLSRTRQISKEAALREIESRYGRRKFALYYPLYKLYKPFHKLLKRLARGTP